MKHDRHMHDRANDERILTMLRMKDAGMTSRQIGAPFGLDGSTVRTLLNRIKADLAKSEEV